MRVAGLLIVFLRTITVKSLAVQYCRVNTCKILHWPSCVFDLRASAVVKEIVHGGICVSACGRVRSITEQSSYGL